MFISLLAFLVHGFLWFCLFVLVLGVVMRSLRRRRQPTPQQIIHHYWHQGSPPPPLSR
jgi:hypothetical protein